MLVLLWKLRTQCWDRLEWIHNIDLRNGLHLHIPIPSPDYVMILKIRKATKYRVFKVCFMLTRFQNNIQQILWKLSLKLFLKKVRYEKIKGKHHLTSGSRGSIIIQKFIDNLYDSCISYTFLVYVPRLL